MNLSKLDLFFFVNLEKPLAYLVGLSGLVCWIEFHLGRALLGVTQL